VTYLLNSGHSSRGLKYARWAAAAAAAAALKLNFQKQKWTWNIYIYIQFIPRGKHTPSRLYKPVS
jgi:glycine/D-amino acid oxidase-like deaminating enzyme